MTTLKVGIASYEDMKARTMAVARGEPRDHRHRLRTIRAYDYRDAASLLGDFWTAVDAVLHERGVIP